ncbi:hypothetical protein [Nicoliella lavandulae]|uniref:Helix-turn-helix domain-containing protein n=1 Tax=Nicoliella lavandulae TaxID=3082954 RepID=A0ABU8SJA8_9LACO
MEITLSEKQEQEFSNYVTGLLNTAIENAERKANLNSPFLKGKRAAAKYLGVSTQTLTKMMSSGLECHYIEGLENVVFFDKREISKFIKQQ